MAQSLVNEIQKFLTETGLSAYRFGILSANNGRLVERLEAGRPILNATEKRVRAFLRSGHKKHQRRVIQ